MLAQADMDTSLVMGLLMTAKRGELPIDFTDWHLANKNGFTVAHAAALYGRLPPTFTQWDFASQDGWTVAHLAARAGHLPADFAQWELKDNDGWTVAHVAAGSGYLHQDFDRWHLADNKGWTVAHEAASRVMLPESFEAWGLTDDQGKTVALIVVSSFRYPQDSPVRQMAQAWIDANAVDSQQNDPFHRGKKPCSSNYGGLAPGQGVRQHFLPTFFLYAHVMPLSTSPASITRLLFRGQRLIPASLGSYSPALSHRHFSLRRTSLMAL